jgi:predicted CoA-binding protein
MDEIDVARRILTEHSTWAVVGASPDRHRASHSVGRMLLDEGYRVIPVNPTCDEVWGLQAYPDLASIPASEGVEVVDVFRRSAEAGKHVDEAIAIGAKAVWFQLGVFDGDAYRRATDAGLLMVMDRCPAIDLPRLVRR